MTTINGIRHAGIDNVFFVTLDGKEMLSTRTSFPGEDTFEYEGSLYRLWNPSVSKLASMLNKGMKAPLQKSSRILYLGAASGTTVSRVADIAAEGIVYAVEFAPWPARDLLKAIEYRENVVPIIADARYPEKYPPFIDSVDMVYQDVAQPDQAAIAVANADKYLINGGTLIMAVKAKSISSTGNIGDIFRNELEVLETRFSIIDKMSLEPLHHNHLAVLGKYLSH
jgi:fibrillarin-like pre-rRNA processing protein